MSVSVDQIKCFNQDDDEIILTENDQMPSPD